MLRRLKTLCWLLILSAILNPFQMAAESASLADQIEMVKPLDAKHWVGWQRSEPADVYVLEAGQKPREWDRLWFEPAAMAVNGRQVLWVGNNHVALGAASGTGKIEHLEREGEWFIALGNAAGFVIADYSQVQFSPDGQTWRTVEAVSLSENKQILAAQASDKAFVLLLDVTIGDGGADYHYNEVVLSTDGVHWETGFQSEPQMGEPEVTMLARAKDRWVVMGVGSRYDSVDGREWAPQAAGRDQLPSLRDGDLRFGGDVWWVVGLNDNFQYSPDGKNWTARPEALGNLLGAGAFWVLGDAGLRNLAFDETGVLRVRTLAEVRAGKPVESAVEDERGLLRIFSMKEFGQSVSPVVVAAGRYAVASSDGAVRFSKDAQHWEAVKVNAPAPLKFVRHDGERWLVATNDRQLATSMDGKKWSPFFPSAAADAAAVQWRGRYWTSLKFILGVSVYDNKLGRYDRGADEPGRGWDPQLQRAYKPALYWRQGDRLRTVLQNGEHYVTENGEYWQITGGVREEDARQVFAAEGNGRVVVMLMTKTGGTVPLVSVKDGDEYPKKVDTKFTRVTGLAYGVGRFVVLAGTKEDPKPAFFESADGLTWTQVGESWADFKDVVFGPAGFVASAGEDKLALYQPEPWAEKPMPPVERIEVPHFSFKDFGSNFVGVGKRRREVPMTADQRKIKELQPALSAAYQGEVPAGVQMGLLMLEGKYVESNPWRAELAFKAGIAAKVPAAARGYAELLAQWKPETPRAELEKLYRQSAELGDTAAMAWLALNLEPGPGSRNAEIEKWRAGALAADAGFAAKWEQMGNYRANIAKAEAGDAAAIMVVAPLLLFSETVPQDHAKAKALLERAVADGDEKATLYVIELYEKSFAIFQSVPKVIDAKEYLRLLNKLSDAGNKGAIARLVSLHMSGKAGVPKDEQKAYDIALALAQKGDVDGMALIAAVYLEKGGKFYDEAKAREWLEKAAAGGHAGAKQWLEQQAKATGETK